VLAQADAAVTRPRRFFSRASRPFRRRRASGRSRVQARAPAEFARRFASDLNVPARSGVMFELVRDMNAAMDQRRSATGRARDS
jgi:hypothetical protein